MTLEQKIEKIQRQRNYWLNKIENQVNELSFLSIEGKRNMFDSMFEDLETSYLILYRFDRRLSRARSVLARQNTDEEVY